jgi:hypothetical protein
MLHQLINKTTLAGVKAGGGRLSLADRLRMRTATRRQITATA